MSTFFANAQNFAIDGGNFSIVQGDQNNYYRQRISQVSEATSASSFPLASGFRSITEATSSRTIATVQVNGNQINHIVQREEKEHTEFDDFRNIKRGDMYKIRTICQVGDGVEGCQCEACEQAVTRTFCTAKVIGVEGEFTAVTYSGRDARKVFEWEFLKYSRTQFTGASQIFAIHNGTIPSMVLWHNLLPLAQFKENVQGLGLMYLETLRRQLRCRDEELWMDSSRGVVCRGPKGPYSQIPGDELEFRDLPPTAELLQEEVLVRFLASHKSKEADDAFVHAMYYTRNDEDVPERVNRPTIFSALTKTPIAVANNAWKSLEDNLVEQTCLENGWTRFRLDGDGTVLLGLNWDVEKAWLLQAWSVFHARGVLLEEGRQGFTLVFPYARLKGHLDESPSRCQQRRQQAIFLFVHPPPPPDLFVGNTSSLHHWSFYKDGQPQLSPECNLGLPVNLRFHNYGSESNSWSTNHYKTLHHYQLLRGFDPTTTDFARHLGYHLVFQPQNDDDRFEDVCEGQTSACFEGHTDLNRSVVSVDPGYRSTMRGSEENSSFGPGISIDNLSPEYTIPLNSNAANVQRWMVNTRSELGSTDTQGYLDQAFRRSSDEYRRGSSYSGVEMLDTSDHLSSRISQHTTVTSSNNYELYPTVQPTMVPSTFPEGLEELVDDCDSPLTSADNPDVEELCALFGRLTIA
ncbi:hypothetical protein PM082_014844 [Marasmius tenuissimus]|nr:hypothetical protein PM082_014844 [Marasmius tenuissimus]